MTCIQDRDIKITATPNRAGNGFDFTMSDKDGNPISDDKIESHKNDSHKKKDYHAFHFTLETTDGSNLAFLKDPFDVMWVAPIDGTTKPDFCPNKRVTDEDFCVGEITDTTLTVYNANSRKHDFKFVLNFVWTKQNKSRQDVRYDPVWTNGNGGAP